MDQAETQSGVSDSRFRGSDPPEADRVFGTSWAHRNAPLPSRPRGVQRGEAPLRLSCIPQDWGSGGWCNNMVIRAAACLCCGTWV